MFEKFEDYFVRGCTAVCAMLVIFLVFHVVSIDPIVGGIAVGGITMAFIVIMLLGWFIKDVMKL